MEAIHKECDKGMFSDFKEQVCIEIIGGNCTAQNLRIAEMYENKYDKSMAKALTRSPKEKLVCAQQAGHHVQSAILGGPELGAAASSEGGCWLRAAL